MTVAVELPLLDAILQASREHDDWLDRLRDGGQHEWRGLGAPARAIAEVFFHGKTVHQAREDWFERRGISNLNAFVWQPWSVYERERDALIAAINPFEATASEVSRAVVQLLRAERLELVERNSPVRGITCWSVCP